MDSDADTKKRYSPFLRRLCNDTDEVNLVKGSVHHGRNCVNMRRDTFGREGFVGMTSCRVGLVEVGGSPRRLFRGVDGVAMTYRENASTIAYIWNPYSANLSCPSTDQTRPAVRVQVKRVVRITHQCMIYHISSPSYVVVHPASCVQHPSY